MIDRALAIFSIAAGFCTFLLSSLFPQLPMWGIWVGFGLAVFLLGLSVGLMFTSGKRYKRLIKQTALLRLHILGDHRTPERLESVNIFRWFYLQTMLQSSGSEGVVDIGRLATLIVTFENDVVISTIRIRSPDMQLPVYEVKEFNQRYAIITFLENVPAGTLEITIAP